MVLGKWRIGALALIAATVVPVTSASAAPAPVVVSGVSQWAALAHQLLGGAWNRTSTTGPSVTELLSDPNADPHEHEATIYDATRVHGASLVIVNGAGYDTWLQQLVTTSARPSINVAALVGVRTGANPHLFYSLEVAQRVVDAIASRIAISPTTVRLVKTQLTALQARVAALRHECAGVDVAATEDVTGYLLGDLGLHVVTPESFRLAIGNGVDPSISAEATAMSTLTKKVAFLVNNVQTATPLTAQLVRSADSLHVPVLNVTETMRGENYVTWMNGVINDVTTALHHEGCAR